VCPKVKLVVVDIDGTLLDKTHMLTDDARCAKHICDQHGVTFTLATGRVASSAEKVACALGIESPIIANGGAAIKKPRGPYSRLLALSAEAAGRVLRIARQHNVERYCYSGEHYMTETCGQHLEYYSRGLGIPILTVPDIEAFFGPELLSVVLRVDASSKDLGNKMERLARELESEADTDFRVDRTLPHMIEITHPQAGKAEALKELCAMLDVPLECTMAIGDGLGDIEMVDTAAVGVLVANAAPELREGRRVTRLPHAAGVLEAVTCYISESL